MGSGFGGGRVTVRQRCYELVRVCIESRPRSARFALVKVERSMLTRCATGGWYATDSRLANAWTACESWRVEGRRSPPRPPIAIVSLRSKLLGLFAALAVLPLIGLGVFDYVRSLSAVRRMIADQTTIIAERTANQLSARFQIMSGDLQLLADNEETRLLYTALERRDSAAIATARVGASTYLSTAWRVIGGDYAWIALEDTASVDIVKASAPDSGIAGRLQLVRVPARVDPRGRLAGWVVAAVRADALIPRALLETRFGRGGYTLIANAGDRILFDPLAKVPRGAAALAIARASKADSAAQTRVVEYSEGDTTRVASIAQVAGAPLMVISAGAVDEFSRSFGVIRIANLAMALLFAGMLSVVFVVLTRRATRPLETLTAATSEIGRGNFAPRLPAAGDDEVGRLSAAFAAMSSRIDGMIAELETSRQMAAVGSFARQIAHEIRNPLTSIKLNLQSLERDVAASVVAPDSRRTVQICVEEINRLDRVVRGILQLGQTASRKRTPVKIDALVSRTLDVMRPQLEEQSIVIEGGETCGDLAVTGDSEQLTGLFLNLFVNAAEAMPDGGRLTVTIERGRAVDGDDVARVTVTDTGPGVATADRDRIFEPFYTTKNLGSGLGLAVAARGAEQHRGRLMLAEPIDHQPGATFVVELPLATAAL